MKDGTRISDSDRLFPTDRAVLVSAALVAILVVGFVCTWQDASNGFLVWERAPSFTGNESLPL